MTGKDKYPQGHGILFNPYGVVNFLLSADFTTGFGLRPTPAAIIVMTPSGSGKEERAFFEPSRNNQ